MKSSLRIVLGPAGHRFGQGNKFTVRSWALKRSAQYGSRHYDKKSHAVKSASLSKDGKTLLLAINDMSPVWQMSVRYELIGANGKPVKGEIQNTIHALGD